MQRKKTNRKLFHKRRSVAPKKNSRMLEMAIAAIFALVVIYAASFAIRVTHGISKTIDTPEYTIRLQILNGCGVDGAAGRVAKALPRLIELPLEISIIEIDDFKSYHVKSSFLISREKDTDPIEILANQLNIDGDIIYRPIEDNYRSISATIVLGEDFEDIVDKLQKKE